MKKISKAIIIIASILVGTDIAYTADAELSAAIEQGNLFGCQFHPEKSGAEGISILQRFAEIAGGN